jgi:Kef-type K+ transport system membrane component KefB
MILGLELFVIAMVFKIVGVFPFAYLQTKSSRSAFLISIGMTPRGETGIVVGSLGPTYNVLNTDGYFAVILMTLLTTLFGALLFSYLSKEVK